MTLLLLPLLAISLAIILAGVFFSARPFQRARSSKPSIPPPSPILPNGSRTTITTRNVRTDVVLGHVTTAQPFAPKRAMALSVNSGKVASQPARQTFPWNHKIIIVGVVSLFMLAFYGLNFLLPHHGFFYLLDSAPATHSGNQSPAAIYRASQAVIRISQLDPAQYDTPQQYHTWAYSACSAAAMTVVVNAYGHHFRVIDILSTESRLGEITPQMGLLEDVGIAHTLTQFGFKTSWGHQLSLNQVIAIANKGQPVIISFPPERFAGGHVLVVVGGTSNSVHLADSSGLNMQIMTRTRFLQLWGGFSAVAAPTHK
ncbi:MAG: hypothetical protein H0W02_08625 [Ktedonobacteraceae bacterium]|nr:hypothetical protein [Ktedonobacteraceae bacterium]